MKARAAPGRGLVRFRSAMAAVLALCTAGCAGLPGTETPHGPVAVLAVDQTEAQRIISAYREGQGLGGVMLDPALRRVAQHQADAMASANLLSHTVAGPLPARLAMERAERRAMVENVSAGYGSLESAIAGWRRSPAHNANLLFRPVHRMGIAAASAPATRFKTFWALVMTD